MWDLSFFQYVDAAIWITIIVVWIVHNDAQKNINIIIIIIELYIITYN